MNGLLFKRGPNNVLRRCIIDDEVFDILRAFHDIDEPGGGHYSIKCIIHKVLGFIYFYPTHHKYARQDGMNCDQCQQASKTIAST